MEITILLIAALLITYHVVSSARRQSAIADHLEEQLKLVQALFPYMLATNGHLTSVEVAIERFAKAMIGGAEKLQDGRHDEGTRLQVTQGVIERLHDALIRKVEHLERHLIGGTISVPGPNGHPTTTTITGELEHIHRKLSAIDDGISYPGRGISETISDMEISVRRATERLEEIGSLLRSRR